MGHGTDVLDPDFTGGDQDVLLQGVARRAGEGQLRVAVHEEEVVANDVVGGHVIMAGPADAERHVLFHHATGAALVEVVGGGAVATGVGNVTGEVAAQDAVGRREHVNGGPVVQRFHAVVNDVVGNHVRDAAVVDRRVAAIVDFVVRYHAIRAAFKDADAARIAPADAVDAVAKDRRAFAANVDATGAAVRDLAGCHADVSRSTPGFDRLTGHAAHSQIRERAVGRVVQRNRPVEPGRGEPTRDQWNRSGTQRQPR